MSVSNPVDMLQTKRTASGPHILHINKITKSNGPKKLTVSILTHPYTYTNTNTKSDTTDEDNPWEGYLKDMLLDPIIDRRRAVSGKDFDVQDMYPDKAQRESLLHQAMILAIQSLTNHVKGFKTPKYINEPKFQFSEKRPLPKGYRTHSVPVLSTLGEQISAARVISLIRDAYTTKLHLDQDYFKKHAIPCVNDAAINNLIRRAVMNSSSKGSKKDHEVLCSLQLAPGLSDILRKLVCQVIKVHCPDGLESEHGLAPLFKLIEKGHLALGRPSDYDAAISALEIVAQGLLLNCWRSNCGFDDLEAYAASDPAPEDILALAKKIVIKQMKRLVPKQSERFADDKEYSDGSISDLEGTEDEDKLYTLHRLLLRDIVYTLLLKRAISDADFGRVEDLLGVVGVYLLGAGMDNTAMEIMHFVFDLKYVWPEQFGNIMRDSMIVSYFKQSGNAMPTDMSLLNLALYSRFFYESHGWSDEWRVPKTMDEAISLVDRLDQKLAMKEITDTMAREDECCVM